MTDDRGYFGTGCQPNRWPLSIPESGAFGPIRFRKFGEPGKVIVSMSVTLIGLSHSFPDDIEIWLTKYDPFRQVNLGAMLMSDCGGASGNALNNVTITISSLSNVPIPDSTRILPGTYKPTNYGGDYDPVSFPASFSQFIGQSPSGCWALSGFDDQFLDFGSLQGASLDIVTD